MNPSGVTGGLLCKEVSGMEMVKSRLKRVNEAFSKQMLTKTLLQSVTGNIDDLLHLKKHLHHVENVPGLSEYLNGLMRDAENRTGSALLFERIGKQLNTESKKKLIENFLYGFAVKGNEKVNNFYEQEGLCVPRFIVMSPSMRCNLNCTGCYSGLYEKADELTEEEIDGILSETRDLGSQFVVVSGGEPFVKKDEWMRLFDKYSDIFFLVYTNGTLIEDEDVKKLAELGNVVPAISLEGYEKETDGRRGPGVYKKATDTIRALSQAGVIVGTSITYTRDNIDTICTPEYIDHLIDLGAIFSWYFMFMPVGKDFILDMVPTPQQRLECGRRINELRKQKPIFLADFWNDGSAAGGCLAGGRVYLHILNDGSIEPCVFSHFKVDNIRDKTIKEATNSEFFNSIRNEFPYNETGNLKRPCMIIDNPDVLRNAVQKHVVAGGHEHSEDLIQDEKVISWIDSYSKEFADLTEPLWQQEISDPNSRWYKEGKNYKKLFSKEYRKV